MGDVSLGPIVSEPRKGITIPEGSTVPAAFASQIDGQSSLARENAGGLRVQLPAKEQAGDSHPRTPTKGSSYSTASSPVHPSFVETPSELPFLIIPTFLFRG